MMFVTWLKAESETFLFLVTAIGGRPKAELCFLLGRLRLTLLPKERCRNTQWPWVEHPTFQCTLCLRLPDVLERQGLSLNLPSKRVMSLILEKHLFVLEYFTPSLTILAFKNYWLRWTFKNKRCKWTEKCIDLFHLKQLCGVAVPF